MRNLLRRCLPRGQGALSFQRQSFGASNSKAMPSGSRSSGGPDFHVPDGGVGDAALVESALPVLSSARDDATNPRWSSRVVSSVNDPPCAPSGRANPSTKPVAGSCRCGRSPGPAPRRSRAPRQETRVALHAAERNGQVSGSTARWASPAGDQVQGHPSSFTLVESGDGRWRVTAHETTSRALQRAALPTVFGQ